MENQIVVFALGNELFGVAIAQVESIIKMPLITQLPHAPEFVEGVTNLRGKILPIIDLRQRFGLATQEADKNSRIIVVSLDQTEVGMIVDQVSEVLTIPHGAIEPTPSITTTVNSAFITGIARLDQRLVIMLDVQRIVTGEEKLSLQPA